MLGSARIIAIDDQDAHLAGLANCLNRNGIACLRMHVTDDLRAFVPCPDVRIIFSDLNLLPGTGSDRNADLNSIGALLEETIKPTGPYFIVLWTQYPEYAARLRDLLYERLGSDVTRPFDVCPLPKSRHIVDNTGEIRDDMRLMSDINQIVRGMPQVDALFEWESQVLGAAGRTVSSILDLATRDDTVDSTSEVGRILGRLAVETAGKDHVDDDRFRAVNNALLPILADRIAEMRSEAIDEDSWRAALTIPSQREMSSVNRAAKLNRLVHIARASRSTAIERGIVIPLPRGDQFTFRDYFRIGEADAATQLFGCKHFDRVEPRTRWVLVQCQAACDYVQDNDGTVPFYLGLDFPEECRSSRKMASTWRAPVFKLGDDIRCLRVSAICPLPLPHSVVQGMEPLYRLRQEILSDLIYHVHSHGARPGMIAFGKR